MNTMGELRYQLIFPTLFAIVDDFISDKESSLIFNYCKKQESQPHNALEGDTTSSHSMKSVIFNELNRDIPSLNLLNKLQEVLDQYSHNFRMNKTYISNSWFNFQQPGSSLRLHMHQNSIVSGALFVNVDEYSYGIHFENPNPFSQFSNFMQNHSTERTFASYKHIPVKNQLVLFPSWLKHGSNYQKNQTKDRLVLSLNTAHKPDSLVPEVWTTYPPQ